MSSDESLAFIGGRSGSCPIASTAGTSAGMDAAADGMVRSAFERRTSAPGPVRPTSVVLSGCARDPPPSAMATEADVLMTSAICISREVRGRQDGRRYMGSTATSKSPSLYRIPYEPSGFATSTTPG